MSEEKAKAREFIIPATWQVDGKKYTDSDVALVILKQDHEAALQEAQKEIADLTAQLASNICGYCWDEMHKRTCDYPSEFEKLKEQLEAAEQNIKELQAKLWVAKDNSLRTYDGLAEKADKYDEAKGMMEKMSLHLESISKNSCCGQCQEAKLVAKEALAEYEEWKKR